MSDVSLFPFQPIRGCCAGGAIAAALAVLLRMAPSLGFYLLVKEAEHAGARPLLQGEADSYCLSKTQCVYCYARVYTHSLMGTCMADFGGLKVRSVHRSRHLGFQGMCTAGALHLHVPHFRSLPYERLRQ